MKRLLPLLAFLAVVALPSAARAQVYSDSFETDSINTQPTGWQDVGSGTGNNAYALVQGSTAYIGTYDGLNGTHAAYIFLGGGTAPVSQGNDFFNSNIGATFAANTTYTLTYLYAESDSEDSTFKVSFMDNGTDVIPGSVDLPQTYYTFTVGEPVSIDTKTYSNLVGKSIGIDFDWKPYIGLYFRSIGVDDIVVTAEADAVPEPSVGMLLVFGLSLSLIVFGPTRMFRRS
jgi:hypothetical protein